MKKIILSTFIILLGNYCFAQTKKPNARKFSLTVVKPTVKPGNLDVTISNSALFTTNPKTEFTTQTINGCKITPIKYQVSEDKIGTFFISSGKKVKLYPGAVYLFDDIRTESFTPYHLNDQRNPMDLTTDILALNNASTAKKAGAVVKNTAVVAGNEFDYGTINSKWNALLGQSINGSTPGSVKKYLQIVESAEQLKTDFKSMGQVDVSTKIGIEVPEIPVGVSVSNTVSVKTDEVRNSNISNSKSTILLRYEQVFYTAAVTPKAGYQNLFSSIPNESLEDNLVYVSTIDYGMIYYVSIASSASKSDLYQAIKTSVRTNTGVSASFPIEGIPVNAEVDVNTSNSTMTESTAQNILNSSTIRIYQWGGEILNDLQAGGDLNSILNSLNSRTKFSSTNLGAPINYTLAFAKDHSSVWINYDSKYASANCGKERKYDVDIVLHSINRTDNNNYSPVDKIYGKVALVKWELKGIRDRAGYKTNDSDQLLWNVNKESAISLMFNGVPVKINSNNIASIKNLTYQELSDLIFYLKADFTSIQSDKKYGGCSKCEEADKSRRYAMRGQMDEIDARNEAGNWTQPEVIDIGDDKFTDLTCSEGVRKVAANIQFKVYATD